MDQPRSITASSTRSGSTPGPRVETKDTKGGTTQPEWSGMSVSVTQDDFASSSHRSTAGNGKVHIHHRRIQDLKSAASPGNAATPLPQPVKDVLHGSVASLRRLLRGAEANYQAARDAFSKCNTWNPGWAPQILQTLQTRDAAGAQPVLRALGERLARGAACDSADSEHVKALLARIGSAQTPTKVAAWAIECLLMAASPWTLKTVAIGTVAAIFAREENDEDRGKLLGCLLPAIIGRAHPAAGALPNEVAGATLAVNAAVLRRIPWKAGVLAGWARDWLLDHLQATVVRHDWPGLGTRLGLQTAKAAAAYASQGRPGDPGVDVGRGFFTVVSASFKLASPEHVPAIAHVWHQNLPRMADTAAAAFTRFVLLDVAHNSLNARERLQQHLKTLLACANDAPLPGLARAVYDSVQAARESLAVLPGNRRDKNLVDQCYGCLQEHLEGPDRLSPGALAAFARGIQLAAEDDLAGFEAQFKAIGRLAPSLTDAELKALAFGAIDAFLHDRRSLREATLRVRRQEDRVNEAFEAAAQLSMEPSKLLRQTDPEAAALLQVHFAANPRETLPQQLERIHAICRDAPAVSDMLTLAACRGRSIGQPPTAFARMHEALLREILRTSDGEAHPLGDRSGLPTPDLVLLYGDFEQSLLLPPAGPLDDATKQRALEGLSCLKIARKQITALLRPTDPLVADQHLLLLDAMATRIESAVGVKPDPKGLGKDKKSASGAVAPGIEVVPARNTHVALSPAADDF